MNDLQDLQRMLYSETLSLEIKGLINNPNTEFYRGYLLALRDMVDSHLYERIGLTWDKIPNIIEESKAIREKVMKQEHSQ